MFTRRAQRDTRARGDLGEVGGGWFILDGMAFLAGLKKELADGLAQQQRNVLVQLLHKRLSTLTLEELRQFLVSPLGSGLGSLRLAEIRDGVADVPTSRAGPVRASRASRGNKTATKSKSTKTGAKKTRGQVTHKPKAPKRRASPSLLESVAEALVAADRALTTAELAERVSSHPVSVRRALLGLIEARRVVTEGPPTRLRYRLARGTDDATRPATGEDLEGRVLAQLRGATSGVPLSQLMANLGESEKRVRTAVRNLESTGQVLRTGERGQTRYSAAGA